MDKRNKVNIHHIVGQCNHKDFNVGIKENKILVDKKQHQALNTLFGHKQSPKEQLALMFDWWFPVLARETREKIFDLLNTDDKYFYIDEISKNGKPKR